MTVIRPNSVSGITSITAQANEINFFRSNGALAGLQLNGVNFNTTTGVSTFNNLDVGGGLTYQDVTNVDSVGIITARSTIDAQGDVSIADKIIHTGDENTSIRFPSADTIRLETGGVARLTVDSSGNTLTSGGLYAQGDLYIADKIIHTGDTNTAIRFPANDTITAETNGSERLRIMSNGNIGIGTINAGAPLHIESNNAGVSIRRSGQYLDFDGNFGGGGDQAIIASSGIRFYNGYSNMRAIINSTGNMGLGVSDPNVLNEPAKFQELTLGGKTEGAGIHLKDDNGNVQGGLFTSDNTGAMIIRTITNHSLLFRTNNTERLRIDSSGVVMINTTNSSSRTLNLKGTFGILSTNQTGVIDMSVTDAGEASIGPYVAGGSSLIFKTNSSGAGVAERLRIDASGLTTLQQASSGNLVEPLRLRNAAAGANTDVGMIFYNNGAGAMARIKAYDAGTYNGGLIFETAPTAGSLNNNTSEALRITNTGAFYIKSPNGSTGDQPGEIQWWNENGAGVMAKIVAHREGTNYAPSGLKFYTTQNVDTSANNSQGDITERLFINSEGKFYKGGHQFYPCVQIYEARLSGSVSNSTVGSYQDIKTVATYTPKKVGNRVHVQVICQSWNGSQTDGQSDAYARLQHNNGGSYSTFTECDRVQGNFQFDERYHHNPFIMDGWFTTTSTNSTTIKFQGMQYGTLPTAFNWFHSYGGRVTIMEYDIT